MLTARRRGKTYHADLSMGRVHVLRRTLKTESRDVAVRQIHKLEIALVEGAKSDIWTDLKHSLPPQTFKAFADYAGFKEKPIRTWTELLEAFGIHMNRQVLTDKIDIDTADVYQRTLKSFSTFLAEKGIEMLNEISAIVIEDYETWRLPRIKKRPDSDGTSTLSLELAHLHHVFAFAIEKKLVDENPVPSTAVRRNPERGAQPYTSDEMARLFGVAGIFLFLLLWFRWTGFRVSDAVAVRFQEVDFDRRIITHVCQKNRRRRHGKVTIPIRDDLYAALLAERERRDAQPHERVLVHPITGESFNVRSARRLIKLLGKRAGVEARPHRFRDFFAVDLLGRSGDVYLVAKLLGDRVETVIEYYVPFIPELVERARNFLNNGTGIEAFAAPQSRDGKSQADFLEQARSFLNYNTELRKCGAPASQENGMPNVTGEKLRRKSKADKDFGPQLPLAF